jgi:hypothetical protein
MAVSASPRPNLLRISTTLGLCAIDTEFRINASPIIFAIEFMSLFLAAQIFPQGTTNMFVSVYS